MLTSIPISNVFDYYDEQEKLCYYNNYCNGEIIPGSTTATHPYFDTWAASGYGNKKCAIPIKCGNISVGDRKYSKRIVRAIQYRQILQRAIAYLPEQEWNQLMNYFISIKLKNCDWVRYCPANMRISEVYPGLFGGSGNLTLIEGTTDCYRIHCRSNSLGLNPIEYCISSIVPSIMYEYENSGTVQESCRPLLQNLYQLIYWESQLIDRYGQLFTDSDLWHNYINPYRADSRARCTDIVFCENDFSVLGNPNINFVDCDVPPINCDFVGWEYTGGCLPYACIDQVFGEDISMMINGHLVQFKGHLEWICEDFPGNFFGLDGEHETKFVTNPPSGGSFRNLGIAIREGRRAPKGIVNFDNVSRYYDYAPSSRIDSSDEIPGLEYLLDDWDEEQIVFVRSLEDQKKYLIEYQDTLIEWSNLVESNDYVRIAYFDKHHSSFWIGGAFSGTLTYGSLSLSTSQAHSGFLLNIAPDGTLLSYNTINNIDPISSVAFAKRGGGASIVGRTLGGSVEMDGTLYQMQEGVVANLLISPSSASSAVFSTFAFDSSMILLKIACSADGDRTTYLLKGTGSVNIGQGQVFNSTDPMVMLLTTDNQGNLIWMDTLPQVNLVTGGIDIAYGSGHNLIMGRTFLGTLQTEYTTVAGNGGKDILLAGYDSLGQITGYLHYGSEDDEDLLQIFFADSILYFGGNFSGPTLNRQIGRHRFLNFSNSASNPYISFVHESALFESPNDFLPKHGYIHSFGRTDVRTFDRVSVYPNPFSNELLIRLHASVAQNYSIRLVNSLGKIVNEIVVSGAVGINQFAMLPPDQISPGIYLLQIEGGDGFVWPQKVLKF